MPRVPIPDNAVPLARTTDAKFYAADVSPSGIGEGLQRLGAAVNDFARVEAYRQELYDDTAAKQAYSQADARVRDALYTGESAYFNTVGRNAVDAQKPVSATLAGIRSESMMALKNPRQKRAFGEAFDARLSTEMVKVASHANRELVSYGVEEAKARQAGAANSAIDNAADPELYGRFVATGEGEIKVQGRLQGWSPAATDQAVAEYRSGIVARVADGKMTADPVGAAAWYSANSDKLLPADRQKIADALYQPLMERQAAADVDGLMGTSTGALVPNTPVAPTGGGSIAGRMVAITAFTESRNRDRDSSGRLVTSPAGAQGRMQVMPGTNRDPGFGVRPAADNGDEERARVGRDYLAAMMKRYGNDPAKAWAAYNAGPGVVDRALGKGGDWLSRMPQETRDYVATNTAALGVRGNVYAPRRDDLDQLYAAIDRQPWDYERKKLARAEVDGRVARDDRLKARQEEDAKDAAYGVIEKLGPGFTSMSQIPAEVRRNLSPEMRRSLTDEARVNAKPVPIPANGAEVVALHQQAALDPDAFTRQDLRTYRTKMTAAEYDDLSRTQAKMLAKPAEKVSYSRVWSAVTSYGRDVGIDMAGQRKGENDEAFQQRRRDGYALFNVMRSVLDSATEGKRQPTDAEIKGAFDNAIINRRMADGTVGPRFRDSSLPTNSIVVPTAEFGRIQAALRARGQPSDPQSVSRWYLLNRPQ